MIHRYEAFGLAIHSNRPLPGLRATETTRIDLTVERTVDLQRAFVTPATYHPNEAWVCDQAQEFAKHVKKTRLGLEGV